MSGRPSPSAFPPPPPSGASARDVAERAGVSVMTVSRALNGANGVSEATRDRIRRIASELGYEPNRSARSLKQGSSQTIAMLLASSYGLRGEYHSDALAGFESGISAAGYDLLLMVPAQDEGIAGVVRRLVNSSRCDAVAMRVDLLESGDIRQLADLNIPMAMAFGAPDPVRRAGVRFSSAGYDNAGGIGKAVRHLVKLGHRRIAYLGGTPGWFDSEQREAGFRGEMLSHGIDVREDWVRPCDFASGVESGRRGLDMVLATGMEGPTAVVCASDKIAAGAMACARHWNLSIPGDLSVTGYDGDEWTEFSVPPLTTVRQDGFEFGKVLADLLLEEIRHPEAPGRHVLLEAPLIVRSSTAPPTGGGTA